MTDDELRALIERLDAAEATEVEAIAKAMKAIKTAEARVAGLQSARATLTALYVGTPAEFDKLSDACRSVLKANAGKSMSPLEIRDTLHKSNYNLKKHTNPLASIHSVLKQMAESDNSDVKSKDAKDGTGKRYWWAGEKSPAFTVATSPALTEAYKRMSEVKWPDAGLLSSVFGKIQDQPLNSVFSRFSDAVREQMVAVAMPEIKFPELKVPDLKFIESPPAEQDGKKTDKK